MKQAAHTQARHRGEVIQAPGPRSKTHRWLITIVVAGKKQVLGQAAATQITVRKLEGERNA